MTNAYELNNIKVFHHQNVCALDIPQFSIHSNKCIALLGENGAGKSTLLNLLAFTARPSQGSIALFDQKITGQLKPQQRKKSASSANNLTCSMAV